MEEFYRNVEGMGRVQRALEHASRAAELLPRHLKATQHVLGLADVLGDPTVRRLEHDAALLRFPHDKELVLRCVRFLQSDGQERKAIRILIGRLRHDPFEEESKLLLILGLMKIGKNTIARALVGRLERPPRDTGACVAIYELLATRQEYKKALVWAQYALEADPHNSHVRFLFTQSHALAGHDTEVVRLVEEWGLKYPAAQYLLALAHHRLGNNTAALPAIEIALAGEPDNAWVKELYQTLTKETCE
jgi:tetratricopeptide (TPR) repeat protein